jgi:hypothetical protein
MRNSAAPHRPEVSVSSTGQVVIGTPTQSRKKPVREVDVDSYVEDPDMADLRQQLLKSKDFATYNFDDLNRMYWHLRDYLFSCGLQHRYEEALESQKLLEYLKVELDDRRVSALTKGVMESFRTTLQAKEEQYVSADSSARSLRSWRLTPDGLMM